MSWRWAGPGEGARRRHLCQAHKDHGAPTAASPGPPGLPSPVHPSGNLLLRAELDLTSYVELEFHKGKLSPQKQVQEIHAKSK